MYDAGKIIPGLVIFFLIMISPILKGVAGNVPKPEKPTGYEKCVMDKQFMRTSHMKLLDDWRDEVVRDAEREKILVDDKEYEKSLQNGCMHCHTSKKKFCDQCHEYTAVKPYCWDCHVQPKE